MTIQRALVRFVGLWAVIAGVELLERAAYRAGALDASRLEVAAGDDASRPAAGDVDDDLEAFDASDVIARHVGPAGIVSHLVPVEDAAC